MGLFRASDAISGGEGKAYIVIDGQQKELFYATNIEVTAEKNKESFKVIGQRNSFSKTTGVEITGSMTIQYMTSLFRKQMQQYVNDGIDMSFDLIVTNEDKASRTGRQTVAVYGCNLDSVILAKLDADNAILDEDVDFTADSFAILSEFNEIV